MKSCLAAKRLYNDLVGSYTTYIPLEPETAAMQDREELQGMSKKLLPVDGNCYSTPHGIFDCEVIEERDGKPESDGVKLEVRLTRRVTKKKPISTLRRFIIHATKQAVVENRLSLVIEVHKWAISAPTSSEYLEKEVWI